MTSAQFTLALGATSPRPLAEIVRRAVVGALVVLTLANPRDVAVAASSLVRRHRRDLPGRYHLRGRRATIVTRGDFGRQLDGDVIDDGHVIEARVRPGALVVRVP